MKKTVMEKFLSVKPTHTLVFFKDEKEIPDTKKGINLFAPYYECSFSFDPALDILTGSSTVNQAARTFCEALVTDADMLSARDPIWSYNSRGLLSALFIGGVHLWRFMHKQSGGQTGEDFPSLTDTIFGMIDDLASCRIKNGDNNSRVNMSFPEWWNVIPDTEQEFIRTTVLFAPMNTAGSLLAVVNSYTGGIMRLYSGGKCPTLFNPDWPENVFVYLPSINAQMLGILLKTAKTVWKNELRIVACGVSSWGKRSVSVLGDFFSEVNMDENNFLMLGSSPTPDVMNWYTGNMGWGDTVSAASLTFFRRKVEETTGNQNGLLTALTVETPERCSTGEWLQLSEAGWSVEYIDSRKIEEMENRLHIFLRPEDGGQSEEVRQLRTLFSDGEPDSPFAFGENGTILLRSTDLETGQGTDIQAQSPEEQKNTSLEKDIRDFFMSHSAVDNMTEIVDIDDFSELDFPDTPEYLPEEAMEHPSNEITGELMDDLPDFPSHPDDMLNRGHDGNGGPVTPK